MQPPSVPASRASLAVVGSTAALGLLISVVGLASSDGDETRAAFGASLIAGALALVVVLALARRRSAHVLEVELMLVELRKLISLVSNDRGGFAHLEQHALRERAARLVQRLDREVLALTAAGEREMALAVSEVLLSASEHGLAMWASSGERDELA